MADTSIDYSVGPQAAPSAVATQQAAIAPVSDASPQGPVSYSVGQSPGTDYSVGPQNGYTIETPAAQPLEHQDQNTDVMGEIGKAIVTGEKQPINLLPTIEAEYHNIGQNSILVNYVRSITGTGDYDVQLKSLTDQQTMLQQKLDVLHRAEQEGHAEPALQRVYEQANISVSQELAGMAQIKLDGNWRTKTFSGELAKAGASTKNLLHQMRTNPLGTIGEALKGVANSIAADPELIVAGPLLKGAAESLGIGKAAAAADALEDAENAKILGTSLASPTQEFTAKEGADVVAAGQNLDKIMQTLNTTGSALRGAGVSLKTPLLAAAAYTPFNLVAMQGRNGAFSPGDAAQGFMTGFGIGVAGNVLGASLGAHSLPEFKNAAIGEDTLLSTAKKLGYDVESPEKMQTAPPGSPSTSGLQVTEYDGPNQQAAAIKAYVDAGGSYNVMDHINQGVAEKQTAATVAAIFDINRNLNDLKAQGVALEQHLNNGILALPNGNIVHLVHDNTGNIISKVSASNLPDGSVKIWSSATDGGYKGQHLASSGYAKLADQALDKGGNLFSSWSVSPDAAAVWEKTLPRWGYNVSKSDASIFDPHGNRWVTKDGSSVFSVVGKDPNAPPLSQILLNEEAKEVSEKAGRLNPNLRGAMFGTALAGAAGAGFAYGYHEKGLTKGLEDAALASALTIIGPRAILGTMATAARRGAGALDESSQAFTHLDNLNGELQALPMLANQIKNTINRDVPNTDNLYKALVKDPTAEPLTPVEQSTYTTIRTLEDAVGKRAKSAGVIRSMVEDYFTRWWKPKPGSPLEADWNTPSARKSRTLSNGPEGLAEAHALGLRPVSTDVGSIIEQYLLNMHRAIALKETAAMLKNVRGSDGELLIQPQASAPRNYMPLKGAFNGYKAHPDVAVLTNMLYDMPQAGMVGKAYDLLNFGLKRSDLSMSLFHAKSQLMNFLMATGDISHAASAFNSQSEFQKALKFGGDSAAAQYLQYSARVGVGYIVDSTTEDLGGDKYYKPLDAFSDKIDSIVPVLGIPTRALSAISHLFDKITFQHGQNYYKFNLWSRNFEAEYGAALNKHLNYPDQYPPPDRDAIARKSAQVANDIYGGQNYYQMIRQMNRGWLQQVSGEILSPSNRVWLQRGLLAPDWTISVARSFTRAITAGGTVPSKFMDRAPYARYLLGQAAFYAAAAGTQQLTTGKWPWETGTAPGYIQYPNGDRIQYDKQAAEFGEYFLNPVQAGINKLAAVPRLTLENLLNKQYLSTEGAPPIIKKNDKTALSDRAMFTAKAAMPIAAQQYTKEGLGGAAASFFGFPEYQKKAKATPYKSPYQVMQENLKAQLAELPKVPH